MLFTLFRTGAVRMLVTLLVGLFVFSPFTLHANTTYQAILAIQEQISSIVLMIEGSSDITEADRIRLLGSIEELENQLDDRLETFDSQDDDVRKNIVSFVVSGDVRSMTADAVIVYDEEVINGELLAPATTTLEYEFVSNNAHDQIIARTEELHEYVSRELSADTGLSRSFVDEQAMYTFERFDDGFDAREYAVETDEKTSLMDHFGSYSVVTNIELRTGPDSEGDEIFHSMVTFTSDQGETLSLAFGAPCSVSGGDDELRCRNDRLEYRVVYSFDDVPVEEEADLVHFTGTNLEIFDFIETPAVGGVNGFGAFVGIALYEAIRLQLRDTDIGTIFEPEIENDEFASMLVPFILNHNAYFEADDRATERTVQDSMRNRCVDLRAREVVILALEHALLNDYQVVTTDIDSIFDWLVPVRYVEDNARGCRDVRMDFFSGLPNPDAESSLPPVSGFIR